MKLANLFEDVQQTLKDARAELKRLKAQVGSNEHLQPRIDKTTAEIAELERKLQTSGDKEKAEKQAHEYAKTHAEKRAKETPEQKKQRAGRAIGQGLDQTNELRKKHGGWEGLAKHVHDHVKSATKDGKEKLTADHIAHHYGTTPRTVNKWLERKEFTDTARTLGRR